MATLDQLIQNLYQQQNKSLTNSNKETKTPVGIFNVLRTDGNVEQAMQGYSTDFLKNRINEAGFLGTGYDPKNTFNQKDFSVAQLFDQDFSNYLGQNLSDQEYNKFLQTPISSLSPEEIQKYNTVFKSYKETTTKPFQPGKVEQRPTTKPFQPTIEKSVQFFDNKVQQKQLQNQLETAIGGISESDLQSILNYEAEIPPEIDALLDQAIDAGLFNLGFTAPDRLGDINQIYGQSFSGLSNLPQRPNVTQTNDLESLFSQLASISSPEKIGQTRNELEQILRGISQNVGNQQNVSDAINDYIAQRSGNYQNLIKQRDEAVQEALTARPEEFNRLLENSDFRTSEGFVSPEAFNQSIRNAARRNEPARQLTETITQLLGQPSQIVEAGTQAFRDTIGAQQDLANSLQSLSQNDINNLTNSLNTINALRVQGFNQEADIRESALTEELQKAGLGQNYIDAINQRDSTLYNQALQQTDLDLQRQLAEQDLMRTQAELALERDQFQFERNLTLQEIQEQKNQQMAEVEQAIEDSQTQLNTEQLKQLNEMYDRIVDADSIQALELARTFYTSEVPIIDFGLDPSVKRKFDDLLFKKSLEISKLQTGTGEGKSKNDYLQEVLSNADKMLEVIKDTGGSIEKTKSIEAFVANQLREYEGTDNAFTNQEIEQITLQYRMPESTLSELINDFEEKFGTTSNLYLEKTNSGNYVLKKENRLWPDEQYDFYVREDLVSDFQLKTGIKVK